MTPENAWRGYPRPQMVRGEWTNLNELWDYAITTNGVKVKTSPFDPNDPAPAFAHGGGESVDGRSVCRLSFGATKSQN